MPRRQLGRYLREAREAAGMTILQAAGLMEWGKTTLQNLETGRTHKVRSRTARELCELYGLDETTTQALVGLAKQIPARSWYHAYDDVIPADFNVYVGLEAGATELTIYQSLLVPGLLQTVDYARALDVRFFRDETAEEVDRRVQMRLRRQNILTRQRYPASLIVVLQEAVLRTVVGDRSVMARQIRHLADMSTRDNIELRVLPFEAGAPSGVVMPPFVILDFPQDARGKSLEPTIVFAESMIGSMYFESTADVGAYRDAFNTVLNASMDVGPSRLKLREMAREYGNGR
nr:helix-turn-helix transcriptional regulator [Nocardia transvalensis]